ncbi:MAG TPA: alanine racemase [bacterium]|nr:alanine racemase [bacterium]
MNITRPVLLLDQQKAEYNLRLMFKKVENTGLSFRPHFKTHQSAEIGNWFRRLGIDKITVSSVSMAEYFADNGWRDITLAFPVNIREIDSINELAQKTKLNLLVESRGTVKYLDSHLKSTVDVWIKIDVGSFRTGIAWDDHKGIKELAVEIRQADKLRLSGLLTHAGHSYRASTVEEIEQIYHETVSRMQAAIDLLDRFGYHNLQISVGDTPGCSVIQNFSAVDEIRPGNFIFYDVEQLQLGACAADQIAIAVACPVVAKHWQRNELVIHGGAVHLSKEFIINHSGQKVFGYITELAENGWGAPINNTFVSRLSQEHGVIQADQSFLNRVNIGDLVAVLPVHSCLTVNLMKKFRGLDGREICTMQCDPSYF